MIVFIPDIHGEYQLLDQLLGLLEREWDFWPSAMKDDDVLVFGGDMIDRGPDSRRVVETIKALVEQYDDNRVWALRGNHEMIAVTAYQSLKNRYGTVDMPLVFRGGLSYERQTFATPECEWWARNGGLATVRSWGARVPDDTLAWFTQLPLSIEIDNFFFSHAPVPPEEYRGHLKGQPYSESELIWTYHDAPEDKWARKHGENIIGVCGHIHALRKGILAPRFYEHYIFGDAGCGCGDKAPLVAISVETRDTLYSWPDRMKKRMGAIDNPAA